MWQKWTMNDRSTSPIVARTWACEELVDHLGDWWLKTGPLYRLLARAIAAAVERGDLAHGARLPSERALAAATSVSRGVVVAAYDQLVADGLVVRRPGSGSYITGTPDLDLPPGREGSTLVGRLVDQGLSPTVIDLSISVLHDTDRLPHVAVSTDALGAAGVDSPWGLSTLRFRIAQRLTAIGLPSEPGQIVVTTGAQQGISIAAGCWVRPGDRVVVDDPTYPGALAAFVAAGAEARPVPVDHDGIVLAALEEALDERPALVYVQSGPHSPTGTRLSAGRRRVIAEWVAERRIPLVEDMALVSRDWSRLPSVRPIAAEKPEAPIAVVGSYSKRFWAGLRVGYVRAPLPVAHRLVRVKATHDLGSSTVSQAMAVGLLEHRDHAKFVDHRNRELAERCALLVGLLREHLPSWTCAVPQGGVSLWVQLPRPVGPSFAAAALLAGVAVATADGLSAHPSQHRDRLRLTFALPETDLREAVHRLEIAWSAFGP